jgi:hypothetical protein
MWANFDPTPYTPAQWIAHVKATDFNKWQTDHHAHSLKPKFITLHNTSLPTLKMWVESGPAHDARLRNLESYYEKNLGWHAGPHAFISRNFINGFSQLNVPGVHCSCFNGVSIGLEMVGDYDTEEFNSGDGLLVRNNAVLAVAALHNALGIEPTPYVYGVSGLHFHQECKHDNHACPGKKVVKADFIKLVQAEMIRQKAFT